MSIINSKLKRFQPYHTDIDNCTVHLDANESFLSLPQELREKISQRVRAAAFNRYPDPSASGVCRAFAEFVGVDAEYVTAGNGSDELISILFGSFLEKGGKALILEPDFSMYRVYCSISECTPVLLKKSRELLVSADEIVKAARENEVGLVIFSNPCNPTGQGLPRQDVLKIVTSLDCLVIVDEAYMDFWNESVLLDAPNYPNLLVLKTCSKMGLAALRLGFAVANSEITGYLRAVKSPYNVNSLTQAAGETVLQERSFLKSAVSQIIASRNSLFEALKNLETDTGKIRVFETHTNFVAAVSPYAKQISAKLKKAGISIRCFESGLMRITAGSPEENRMLLDSLRQILSQVPKE